MFQDMEGGRKFAMRSSAVFAVVWVGLFPSSAFAGTASVEEEDGYRTATYVALRGETNRVELSQSGDTVTIHDSGATITAGDGCAAVTAHEVQCAPVNDADLLLGDRGDEATILPGSAGTLVLGQSGNDVLTAACATCRAGLYGNAGADTLTGRLLTGGSGADLLTGDDSGNGINGGTGNDAIAAGGGHDFVRAGPGDDVLHGGPGADDVSGGGGEDRLRAGRGNDQLDSRDDRRDLVDGGPGRDRASIDRLLDQIRRIEVLH